MTESIETTTETGMPSLDNRTVHALLESSPLSQPQIVKLTSMITRSEVKRAADRLGAFRKLIKALEDVVGPANLHKEANYAFHNNGFEVSQGKLLAVLEQYGHTTPSVPEEDEHLPDPSKGRKSMNNGKIITPLVKENPRRAGTKGWKSMNIVLAHPTGISYEDYRAKGGRPNDLAWDVDKGYVSVQ